MSTLGFDALKDKRYAATRLGRDVADFLAWMDLGGASPRTLDQYERDLARGALMFPQKDITEISDGDMLHIAKCFKPAERRVRMAAWKSFYKWGRKTRRTTFDPTEALPDLRQKRQPVIDVFSDAEIAALLALDVVDSAPLGCSPRGWFAEGRSSLADASPLSPRVRSGDRCSGQGRTRSHRADECSSAVAAS